MTSMRMCQPFKLSSPTTPNIIHLIQAQKALL